MGLIRKLFRFGGGIPWAPVDRRPSLGPILATCLRREPQRVVKCEPLSHQLCRSYPSTGGVRVNCQLSTGGVRVSEPHRLSYRCSRVLPVFPCATGVPVSVSRATGNRPRRGSRPTTDRHHPAAAGESRKCHSMMRSCRRGGSGKKATDHPNRQPREAPQVNGNMKGE